MITTNIFVVTGKSGTGKDSLVNAFFMANKFGLESTPHINKISPHTTRPSRSLKEITSGDYIFTDEFHLHKLAEESEFSEIRKYQIVNPDSNSSEDLIDVEYATIIKELVKGDGYIIIGQIETYISLVKHYESDPSVLVHLLEIKNSPKVRLQRLVARETSSSNPNYRELCRRFSDDEDRFKDVPAVIATIPIKNRYYGSIINNGSFIDAHEQFTKYIVENVKA